MKIKLSRHKTKIVCTIGPASRSEKILKKLIHAGMNVARLNMSHGNLYEHSEDIAHIHRASEEIGRTVALMIDLPGPKIRIGKVNPDPLPLKRGETVTLCTSGKPGSLSLIPVEYPELTASVKKGSLIYLNDGFIQLKVRAIRKDEVDCRILVGGMLLSRKGLNIPGSPIRIDAVTPRDLEFVEFGLEQGIGLFCVSFVERAADLQKIRRFALERGRKVRLVAKIERKKAVKNIDEILDAADALMIARGDLGVETPIADIAAMQKQLIRKANLRGIPVITATQMLESMTEHILPTRAEATDVANAILDGTDAVMLSEETAIGRHPVETVRMMARIAASIERPEQASQWAFDLLDRFKKKKEKGTISIEDVISLDVIEATRILKIRLIIAPTETGTTPRRISRFKPPCWILSFSRDEAVHRFLCLSYGVLPLLLDEGDGNDWEALLEFTRARGLAAPGDTVILTESAPPGSRQNTGSLRIMRL
ncbi:MAG: pyruvate kinase [Deltaproteobacteria bacterium]|nr:pyruvate kinase [Deltaproteobacteria bacterium]